MAKSDITVNAENFNTVLSPEYNGVSVGFALGGTGLANVASVKVQLYDALGNLLVTNTSKASKVFAAGPYSSAFIVVPGTYTTSSTWEFGTWTPLGTTVPAKAVITVTDINGFKFVAENTALQQTEPVHPSWISLFPAYDITVTAENFNTNKGEDYYGVSVGYALGGLDASFVASVSVSLFDAQNNLLVTNTSKEASKVNTAKQYSSAFIVMAGTYSTSSAWNFGVWTPSGLVAPAKAVIVVTDIHGRTYTAENASLQQTEPVHPSWVSLFPTYDITVLAENFNTNLSAEYNGVSVGFALSGVDAANVAAVRVSLYDASNNLLVTNVSKASKVFAAGQYSSAFIVVAGTYTSSSTWDFGVWAPVKTVVPSKAVIVVIDNIGREYTAENTMFMNSAPSHPTWEELFPAEVVYSISQNYRLWNRRRYWICTGQFRLSANTDTTQLIIAKDRAQVNGTSSQLAIYAYCWIMRLLFLLADVSTVNVAYSGMVIFHRYRILNGCSLSTFWQSWSASCFKLDYRHWS
ncbi:MAG: hypothetical protein MZU97_21775 [Bacillus subtilis]|nr:hypothetical protein [Bacillus subtilis]